MFCVYYRDFSKERNSKWLLNVYSWLRTTHSLVNTHTHTLTRARARTHTHIHTHTHTRTRIYVHTHKLTRYKHAPARAHTHAHALPQRQARCCDYKKKKKNPTTAVLRGGVPQNATVAAVQAGLSQVRKLIPGFTVHPL